MEIIDYLARLNLPTVIAMFMISWYFTHDLKEDFKRQAARTDKLSERTDKLYEMFIELLKENRK